MYGKNNKMTYGKLFSFPSFFTCVIAIQSLIKTYVSYTPVHFMYGKESNILDVRLTVRKIR